MIKSISIKNFRCFHSIEIQNFNFVNIFSGKNNVGKTSLLEAIFLSVGSHNATLPLNIDKFRGVTTAELNADDLWGWLFNNHNIESRIQIECKYDNRDGTLLRIYLSQHEETSHSQLDLVEQGVSNGNGDSSPPASLHHLTLESSSPGRETRIATAWVDGGVLKQRNAEQSEIEGVFLTSHIGSINENARRFSMLKQQQNEDRILGPLQLMEPRLKELTLLVQGGIPIVAGNTGLGQLVPLSYLGEGINKLLTIVLAIASFPGGVVIIDEMENGFHHSVLRDIWRVVFDMSRRFSTQLFISTHSRECIEAAFEVSSESSDSQCAFQRIERSNGEIFSVELAPDTLKSAFDSNLEIR